MFFIPLRHILHVKSTLGYPEGERELNNVIPVSFRDLCPEIAGTKFSTHTIHSYPAQLIPQIPYHFLRETEQNSEESTVLDPFCGTGTVMVEAMHNGWHSIGVEINPIAALIAKVKTTPISPEKLEKHLRLVHQLRKKTKITKNNLPSFENLHYWFNEDVIQELAKIKECLESIRNQDILNFYTATFSSIVKDVSRADSRIYVPVLPKRGYKKKKLNPWMLFKRRAKENICRMQEFIGLIKKPTPICRVFPEDFRTFITDHANIDLIITSPPYINAQKYVRSTRLEAYWLGYTKNQQLDIDRKTIGTERITKEYYSKISSTGLDDLDSLIAKIFDSDPIRAAIVSKYFNDMIRVIRKMYSILNNGGKCIIVLGNNTVKGYKVQTSKYVAKICQQQGFSLEKVMVDKILSRALMTKRNTTADLINYEWVLVMRKT